jgi:hypothetical protein
VLDTAGKLARFTDSDSQRFDISVGVATAIGIQTGVVDDRMQSTRVTMPAYTEPALQHGNKRLKTKINRTRGENTGSPSIYSHCHIIPGGNNYSLLSNVVCQAKKQKKWKNPRQPQNS